MLSNHLGTVMHIVRSDMTKDEKPRRASNTCTAGYNSYKDTNYSLPTNLITFV